MFKPYVFTWGFFFVIFQDQPVDLIYPPFDIYWKYLYKNNS